MYSKDLSIIFPIYNEENSIKETLLESIKEGFSIRVCVWIILIKQKINIMLCIYFISKSTHHPINKKPH